MCNNVYDPFQYFSVVVLACNIIHTASHYDWNIQIRYWELCWVYQCYCDHLFFLLLFGPSSSSEICYSGYACFPGYTTHNILTIHWKWLKHFLWTTVPLHYPFCIITAWSAIHSQTFPWLLWPVPAAISAMPSSSSCTVSLYRLLSVLCWDSGIVYWDVLLCSVFIKLIY
jgi:hypothetical protein